MVGHGLGVSEQQLYEPAAYPVLPLCRERLTSDEVGVCGHVRRHDQLPPELADIRDARAAQPDDVTARGCFCRIAT